MIFNEILSLEPLILASGSPRRAEILKSVGWNFRKLVADVDESELPNETPADYVQRLAQTKATAVAAQVEHGLILGADTTVVINNEIIGKPDDEAHARQMLSKLSGHWHEVLTGVCLVRKVSNEIVVRVGMEKTRVKFNELNESEIEYLVQKGDPLDKAGAYAVQGCAALFIEKIEGDYWNVVGLPIQLVYKLSHD
jgi:septum formation protein